MDLELPRVVEIEPTFSCNLRCRMCHVSYMPDEPRPVFDAGLMVRLACLRGAHFIIGSGFEPMMNRDYGAIIGAIAKLDGQIEVVTNGTLMSDENLSALLDADVRLVNFSFDGIRPATYEHIRRRASYQSTIDAILRTRRAFAHRDTLFAVNSTMMRSNMEEVPEIVDFWDRADFDLVRLLTMVVRENDPELIRESLYPVRRRYYEILQAAADDVIEKRRKVALVLPGNIHGGKVISDNPRSRVIPTPRQDHQLGAGPGMTFPCKSPWTFAKILPDGGVQLCYKFTVGNVNEQSFEDIWVGSRAEKVRDRVRSEAEHCGACEYFRFCLDSDALDSDDPISYFARPLLPGLDSVDFATGSMTFEKPEQPMLAETIGAFNIVRFKGRYIVAPHALGPLDLSSADLASIPGLMFADTIRDARKCIG